jgi:hypothetical protein
VATGLAIRQLLPDKQPIHSDMRKRCEVVSMRDGSGMIACARSLAAAEGSNSRTQDRQPIDQDFLRTSSTVERHDRSCLRRYVKSLTRPGHKI